MSVRIPKETSHAMDGTNGQ